MATEFSRMILKRTATMMVEPTVPSSSDINTFNPTDIFVGELFYNAFTGVLWTRSTNGVEKINPTKTLIVPIGSWDMSRSKSVTLEEPIDPDKVVSINIRVRNDLGTIWYVDSPMLYVESFIDTTINLRALAPLTSNINTEINRGDLKIEIIR